VTDGDGSEWDDGCPGLMEILAREGEWKAWEATMWYSGG
jgi:hypothetical protein